MITVASARFGFLCTLLILLVTYSLATFNYEATRRQIFFNELQKIDFVEVKKDIIHLLHSSEPFYPSDYHHYGPFFIRMAWHCAGTYRESDGEGGCDGGRQRFDPEASWEDNANLVNARRLLWPIKQKYGYGLSWGDLMTLTGTVAIEDMKGPVFGWCGGRFDDIDNTHSRVLGPTWEQEHMDNCEERNENGDCKEPLGQNTIGLIYVNPEGFMGKPEPEKSYSPTRDVFARMGMNDSETAALIAGGHSFGKAHKGTSGIEGPWTGTPLEFNADFIDLLLNYDFEKHKGAGNKYQWKVAHNRLKNLWNRITGSSTDNKSNNNSKDKENQDDNKEKEENIESGENVRITAPSADLKGKQDIMMMTTDVALTFDKTYTTLLQTFKADFEYFTKLFGYSWYKLMTRDMGPVSRCFGPFVPEAQDFQDPLPEPSFKTPKLSLVEKEINNLFQVENFDPALFSEIAFLCAETFRVTDYKGGCNGGRLFLPTSVNLWPKKLNLTQIVEKLKPIQTKFAESDKYGISISDLVVFSGTVALNSHNKISNISKQSFDKVESKSSFEFCSGRVDTEIKPNSEKALKIWKYSDKSFELRRRARLLDISVQQLVAIIGRPRSAEYFSLLGYSGTYSASSSYFSNEYFKLLISQNWTKNEELSRNKTESLYLGEEYVNEDKTRYMTEMDIVLKEDDELLAAVFEFAGSETLFETVFIETWTKLMNNDRFDGPIENLCENGKAEVYQLSKKTGNEKTEQSGIFDKVKKIFSKEKVEL